MMKELVEGGTEEVSAQVGWQPVWGATSVSTVHTGKLKSNL